MFRANEYMVKARHGIMSEFEMALGLLTNNLAMHGITVTFCMKDIVLIIRMALALLLL